MSLDKVIVVTGASAGIGAAFAKLAAKRGASVVLVARRETELRAVAVECGANALVVVADVTKRADHERVLTEAISRFGHVDVWINNAGRGMSIATQALTDDDFDEMMRVNVKSALYGMQTAVAHFQERGTGHVINVSSLLGRVPFATFRSAYCAAKHALNALTACLRVDVSRSHPGVHVSTVSPGVVATEFGVNAIGGGPDSRTMPGSQTAEEVAAVILDVIEHPRADAYTRPGAREMIAAYYAAEDMAELEKGWMAPPR
ncbi:MAG: SDR family NAD(P)-dependent oxidoreductase [Candidatus Eisenbacteria bacterium]|nr:SDR family NAD(P)-dependent oxidoreductase [Candidatus Eisenbacteria bacterium]